ncbi:MAG: CocE/NonD family hydrolase, partial [Candidatus Hodarchaeota archaeon]
MRITSVKRTTVILSIFISLSFFSLSNIFSISKVSATDPNAEGWPIADLIPPYAKFLQMRDDVKLATLAYENGIFDIGERGPTLLIRSPYDISGSASDLVAFNFLSRFPSLFVVTQDMRGRYNSEGVDTVFGDDWQDGYDTLQWIKSNTTHDSRYTDVWWNNGKIGSWGASALCINQYTYAGEGDTNLVMQYLSVGSPEQYDHIFFQGGQFRYNMIMSWTDAQGAQTHQYAQNTINAHPLKDSWWSKRSLEMNDRYARVHASGVHFGGWDDPFSQGTVDGFVGYNYNGAPDAQGHQILIMGGIGHGAPVGEIAWPDATAVPVGDTEDFLINAELMEIYGARGSAGYESAWAARDKVFYYVYSDPAYYGVDPLACSWRTTNDWPVPSTPERWYLHKGADQWSGELKLTLPTTSENQTYVYDPNDPCPTNGGNNLFDTSFVDASPIGWGSTDQRGLGSSGAPGITDRFDVISFSSDNLTSAYEFTGNVKANLYVQSLTPDTDFVAKLIDVFPDGREMLVTDGIVRACRMNGFNTTTWMTPGTTYNLTVDLWSKVWRFQPGHKIKLLVTSSNYPRFQRNPNRAQEIIPIDFGSNYDPTINMIMMSPSYPSNVELPITDGVSSPSVNFSANTTVINPGDSVQFNFSGQVGNEPVTYNWDFGDGTGNSTEKNPTHVYNTLGTFNVTLTVTDWRNLSDSLTKFDFINVQPSDLMPVANFEANMTLISLGNTIQFNYTGTDGDPPMTYNWDFGDGIGTSTLRDPIYQYLSTGNFTVELSVSDNDGDMDMVIKPNYIQVFANLVPDANFTANSTTILEGESIQFNYTGTFGDGIASYQWDFGDSSGNSTQQDPVHQYTAPGNYTVTLTVNDTDGDADTEVKVGFIEVIADEVPVANFTATPVSILEGEYVQFNYTGTAGNGIDSYQWDFGDSTGNSSLQDPNHQYNTPGNYTVTLTVNDTDGDADTETKVGFILVIADEVPVANFTASPVSILEGEYVQFNYTGTAGNGIDSYQWDFGDSSGNSSLQDPNHQYTVPGNYTVILTVNDTDGDVDTETKVGFILVIADEVPVANFTASP